MNEGPVRLGVGVWGQQNSITIKGMGAWVLGRGVCGNWLGDDWAIEHYYDMIRVSGMYSLHSRVYSFPWDSLS